MKICVIGSGYVGLVTSACFADFGNEVVGVDTDAKKLSLLRKGLPPFYEPGLEALIKNNLKEKRLTFSANLSKSLSDSEVVFICVGTPAHIDGSVDLSYLEQAAKEIGEKITTSKIVVIKSTVPVGTSVQVNEIITAGLSKRHKNISCPVASNPEFLREGSAVFDAMHPNRIIVGTVDESVRKTIAALYRPLYLLGVPIVFTNNQTAELAKYAANAFLATKISFINEIANLSEKVGADVKDIAKALSFDNRIGGKFLHSGIGYGGSCFPKDTRGLVHQARLAGCELKIVPSAIAVNNEQVDKFCRKIKKYMGDLNNKNVGILGLSFKPNTDDLREAPALKVIAYLQREKAKVKAFDPVAMPLAKKVLKKVKFCGDAYEAAKDAQALLIITEWNEFRNLDLQRIKKLLKRPLIIDGRNIYDPAEMKKHGFIYAGVGRS